MAGAVLHLHGGEKTTGRIEVCDRDGADRRRVCDAHGGDDACTSFACAVSPHRGVGIEAVGRNRLLSVCGRVCQLAGAGSRIVIAHVAASYGRGAKIINPVDDCPIAIGKSVAGVVCIFAAGEDIEWRSECRSGSHDKAWRKVMPIRAITVFGPPGESGVSVSAAPNELIDGGKLIAGVMKIDDPAQSVCYRLNRLLLSCRS